MWQSALLDVGILLQATCTFRVEGGGGIA